MSDVRVRIPIEITVRVGDVEVGEAAVAAGRRDGAETAARERFVLDDDYAARPGYDEGFLGADVLIPRPSITKEGMKLVSRDPDQDGEKAYVLDYHHFSIVMNRERRMCFFAACNTTRNPDLVGSKSRSALQGGARDKWILDPRIPAGHQVTTKELYGPTEFDRGHVVRREDAYWGEDEDEAEFANFDTFHYTNCTPQHPAYNQSSKDGVWGRLEDHIASEARAKGLRLTIFAGPVFAQNDPYIYGVKIPRRYWKVVLARKDDGGRLGAWAFLLSQAALVAEEKDRHEAAFSAGDFETYQVPVARIEELTEVRFPEVVRKADARAGDGREAAGVVEPVRIDDLARIRI